ncbi:G-alpha-domain-containing protein [Polyplosphaeria fusca]|uniref:G-alpha-domain-containing protein n=1 Tax=Polyplosphaeria fusca TaxID=682080 RepID=A0A9P4QT23_9PLEO|nr:G-alpha-domain-containing protein [Polyplosphaeria fusca]
MSGSGASIFLDANPLDETLGKEELDGFKKIIHARTVRAMRSVIEAADILNIQIETKKNRKYILTIQQCSMDDVIDVEKDCLRDDIAEALEHLSISISLGPMSTSSMSTAFEYWFEYTLDTTAQYLLQNTVSIVSRTYTPTVPAIIDANLNPDFFACSQIRINMHNATVRNSDAHIVKTREKGWLARYTDTQAVIFVAAVSDYDVVSPSGKNRLDEAADLFGEVLNEEAFRNVPILLVLNRVDVFRKKIAKAPLGAHMPEYTGLLDEASVLEYVLGKFVGKNRNEERQVYTHFATENDEGLGRFLVAAAEDIAHESKVQAL